MAKLAISKDYFQAYVALPRKAQRKADEFLSKFQQNSTTLAIHLEPIHALDPQLRSARIGDDYRVILRAPEKGDVFLVLWADHHDEAYRWAATKQTAIHPLTGSLQIFDPVVASAVVKGTAKPLEAPVSQGAAEQGAALFASHTDDQLFLAGVPKPLLPSVRSLRFDEDLDALVPHLPPEAAETLTGLASGLSLDEALEEVLGRTAVQAHAPAPAVPDILDVAAALARETTQRQFRLLGEDLDLDAALNHPLDVWRVFLHPKQRKIAHARTKGPVRVLGGAGTGKTVVAMHRAAFLAREVYKKPDDRILFTTFTANLAEDIRAQIAKLVQPDDLARIEIRHIDAWATEYLRRKGKSWRPAMEEDRERHFRGAYDVYGDDRFSHDFYFAEWRDVVQEQGITSEDEYVKATRRHRGVPLARTDRRKLWPVFQAYREALEIAGLMEWPDLHRACTRELASASEPPRYRSVVVDEAQDFSLDALRLVRAIAGPEGPDDLFLVGDAHQRIYGRPAALSSAGIQVRGRRSQTLRLNYRTTGAICRYATRVLADLEVDDLDEGKADRRGYVSLREGPAPMVKCFDTELEETQAIVGVVQELAAAGVPFESICVMSRTRGVVEDRVAPALERASIPGVVLKKEEPRQPGVRLSTMHRAKGLEFGTVIVADASAGSVPLSTTELRSEDPIVAALALAKEKSLLYVASSRARDDLYIFANKKLSPLIPAPATTQAQDDERPARASKPPPIATSGDVLATHLESLPFPTRLQTWAERVGVQTLGELLSRSPDTLHGEKNMGRTTIRETKALIERLTGTPWELHREATSPAVATVPTLTEALNSGSWDMVRAALPDALRSKPLAEMGLPARLQNYASELGLVTLGDLATRSRRDLHDAPNLGRGTVKDLIAAVAAIEGREASDRALSDLGLLDGFKALVAELEPIPRLVLTRRSGLGGPSETLQEVGTTLGVSRERARQIEERAAARLLARPWARFVRERVQAALDSGGSTFSELATDSFWQAATEAPEVVRFIVETVIEQGHVIDREDEPWLVAVSESALRDHETRALRAVRALVLPCLTLAAREAVAAVTVGLGSRLQAMIWDAVSGELRVDVRADGAEVIVAFGSTRKEAILAHLRMAPEPVTVEELTRLYGRGAPPEEAILFDWGRLGLKQHFDDWAGWKSRLVPRAEEIVASTAPGRQWSCAEIHDELREEFDLPQWLTPWGLAALIKSGSKLKYLGRMRVALQGVPENEDRILVHEEVRRILESVKEPMTREELTSRVNARLGATELALTQVFSRPQFVKLDGQRIGLLDRDVAGGATAISDALDQIESLFTRRGKGLSYFAAHQAIVGLSAEHATWTPELLASLLRGDGRFRVSQSGAAGLATWESTRVPTRLELVKSALSEAGDRVSVEAVLDRIEAHYGERSSRGSLGSLAMHVGASLDGDWIVRVPRER